VLFFKVEDVAWMKPWTITCILRRWPAALHLRERLSALATALDPDQFFRIHRSP